MLYIASDYAGYTVKERIKKILEKSSVNFVDVGCTSALKKNDFTDYIKSVVQPVQLSNKNFGILVCGTGQGMTIGANRFKKIRATLVYTPRQARFARTHDNSNVLVVAAWEVRSSQLYPLISAWLKTPFQPLARRVRRLKKIDTWPQ
ncbi:MAG: RpiB/LacA/LacB family sugar-phosphate isomerase [Candidatus Kerfeldbacteria bacterium]|nr:RpiB/LacA/LacB family sugar-phosphate isomerase [Candidatus Kerfeldbacteria bacterium]